MGVVAIKTVLEAIEKHEEIVHRRKELLTGLLDDELSRDTMFLTDLDRLC